jgi:L-malate glycosyltransferase
MPATSGPHKHSVVHFASGDLWGGAEAVVFTLVREQQRRNPGRVACVLMNPGQLADRLKELGVPLLVLDESSQGMGTLVRLAGAFVDTVRPAVLHAHRRKENVVALLVALRRFARPGRLARVTTIHGMPEPVTQGNRLRRRVTEFVNDFTLTRGFDALVAVSRDIEQRMRARLPRATVVCVHNGVETAPLPPAHSPADAPRPLRLLALGRLVPIKRFERLRAISDALSSVRERPEITLAGDGPLQAELTRTLGVDDPAVRISMPGFIAQPEPLFAGADALLITSDHEGIPMVALEALARGIPVFGFAVGGLPEIAESGVPMKLVAPGDSAALARAVHEHFAATPAGLRQPPPAHWKFSIEHCVDEYERLYARVAGNSADTGQA